MLQPLHDPLKRLWDYIVVEPSYIIFKIGNTILAKNGSTGEIEFSGTDAANVIQSAIDALGDKGGKIVIKGGMYEITRSIKLPDKVSLIGEGKKNTTLKLIPDIAGWVPVIRNKDFTAGNAQIRVAHLEVDGNRGTEKQAGKLGGVVHFCKVTDSIVEDVYAHHGKTHGLEIVRSKRIVIRSCLFVDCGDDGMSISDGANALGGVKGASESRGICVIGCIAKDNNQTTSSGFEIDDGPADVTFVGCYAENNAGAYRGNFSIHLHTGETRPSKITYNGCIASGGQMGFECQSADYVTYNGCLALAPTARSGFGCENSSHVSWTGCMSLEPNDWGWFVDVESHYCLIQNCLARRSGYAGITVGGSDVIIDGCMVRDTQSYPGIRLYKAKRVIVSNCEVVGNYAAGILVHADDAPVDDIRIVNNRCLNNNQGKFPEKHRAGIAFRSNGANGYIEDLSILGNRCYDNQAEKTQRYGIGGVLEAGGTHNRLFILFNDVKGNAIAGIDVPLPTEYLIHRNIGYVTENSGTTYITGDGVATSFTVDVPHGLVSDKLSAKVACKKPATYKWWLVDTDADGTYETLRIEITFDTAPASGETVEIYWEASVV